MRARLLGLLLVLVSTILRLDAQREPDEVRAIAVVGATLSSPRSIVTMVEAAKGAGFNTLLVQLPGQGDAHPAASEPPAQPFDAIAEVIDRAHEAGLRVHGWVDVMLASSAVDLPLARDHVVYRHPEWLMVPHAIAADLIKVDLKSPEYLGRLTRHVRAQAGDIKGLYLSPANPAAVRHLADAVRELVGRYAFDGVHFDNLGFPWSDFDYGRETLTAFRRSVADGLSPADLAKYDRQLAAEPLVYTEAFPDRWRAFRTDLLTTLVARLHETVKSVRPGAIVSATVAPDPEQAAATKFQDWRSWLGRGLIDAVYPTASTADLESFAREVEAVRQVSGPHPVWAGIGAARLSQHDIVASVKTARQLGAGGVILFSYDTLTDPSRGTEYLAQVGRAAFME
jgi:uncharacterized lipoprotein YddW (UPF0748 family)